MSFDLPFFAEGRAVAFHPLLKEATAFTNPKTVSHIC